MLIKNGANLNDRAVGGLTALMVAARDNRNPEIITTLLKNGADAKAKDAEGRTALVYASTNQTLKNSDVYWTLNNATY